MKKIAAILLVAILVFNWIGYRLLSDLLLDKAEQSLVADIDNNDFDSKELITIKVPTNLPYSPDNPNFERVNGSVTINNVQYNYVKRRIYRDSLELICLPNIQKTGIVNARDDFFRLANDLVKSGNKKNMPTKHAHLAKMAIQEVIFTKSTYQHPTYFSAQNQSFPIFTFLRLPNAFLQSIIQPPEVIS